MDVRSLLLVCLTTTMTGTVSSLSEKDIPHSRQKRIIWITNDGRLALPPGTSLIITPSLSMPFIRHPPEGFFSNITVSLPFTKSQIKIEYKLENFVCTIENGEIKMEYMLDIDFDKLGLTDNENPYGDLSPIFSKSFGRAAGGMMATILGQYLDKRRGKREAEGQELPPNIEKHLLDRFHGGERALLYGAIEDFIANFGVAGKPCLLRAICEVHAHPLTNFGLMGEMLKLFFTASRSPYNELLQEYVDAEKAGAGDTDSPGECWPYYKECPKSLFLARKNKYSENAEQEHENEVEEPEFKINLKDVNMKHM